MSDNFITQNAYACIELNARNLVILIRKFRDQNMAKFFIPTLFNSQPCEETFRKLRSMGIINYTKINFTLLELIHLVGRVELLNEIMFFKLADVDVKFPRNRINESNFNEYKLPSDDEIKQTLKLAKRTALNDAKAFRISVTGDDIENCELRDVQINLEARDEHIFGRDDIEFGNENNFIESKSLKNYNKEREKVQVNESSPFVEVTDTNGSKIVRKSSFMWLLSDSKDKLSSDRLRRVQGNSKNKSAQRRLEFVDVNSIDSCIYKMEEIKIGDWCILHNESNNSGNEGCQFILGIILSFKYIRGKTEKEKEFPFDFASTHVQNDSRSVEVLATWYQLHKDGKIENFIEGNCSFIDIKWYFGILANKAIRKEKNGQIRISDECLNIIKTYLEQIK